MPFFNLNDEVRFTPNESGKLLYAEHYREATDILGRPLAELKIDESGRATLTFHEFMYIFGPHMIMGTFPPVRMDVEVLERKEPLRQT